MKLAAMLLDAEADAAELETVAGLGDGVQHRARVVGEAAHRDVQVSQEAA